MNRIVLASVAIAASTIVGVLGMSSRDAAPAPLGSTTARSGSAGIADVTNVKDFGAVGDGKTNDSAAVSAAHSAAKASKTILYFPPGTYNIRQLVPGPYDRIIGAGWQRTILRPVDSSASLIYINRDAQLNGYSIEIADLTLFGFRTGSGHGIEATATRDGAAMLRLHDVQVDGFEGQIVFP